jgi:hypothetical protein
MIRPKDWADSLDDCRTFVVWPDLTVKAGQNAIR